jgi:cell division protein FtsI/penicillin-binding protein 2
LTIDSVIQQIVETALSNSMRADTPASISSLVIRPRTGEILALAVLPNFDPNNPGSAVDALRNRVIADRTEPGSTFKIVVASGALSDRLVTLAEEFDCEQGQFHFSVLTLHDHLRFGRLSVENIIAKSSNIGAAKIGIKMGGARLLEHIRDFGFDTRTGISLPGEVRGQVEKWTKVSIAQIPMGQGIAVTSLQMAMAMCAIANKGVLMRPLLVDRIEEANGNVVAKWSPEPVRRVISEDADKQIVQALKTVVSTNGTGPKAALEHYTVAGKTGTAQKVPYSSNKFYASFIGFFPADDPQICIYVSLDDPKGNLHQGGQIAAPTFREIAEKTASYLNLRPDKDLEPIGSRPDETNSDQVVKTAQARSP